MSKKILAALLCLGLIALVYFSIFRPTTTTTSLEETICAGLSEQYGDDCKKIIIIDADSNLVFAENDLGIMPVLTNKGFTEIIKFIHPLDFQEYREENRPISWQVDNNLQKDFSMISGFASEDAKAIIINSEGGIQPNRFFIQDNLWFWYATFKKDKITVPANVTAYDENGQIIYSDDEEE